MFLQTDQPYEGGYANHPLWVGMNKNIITKNVHILLIYLKKLYIVFHVINFMKYTI